MVIIASDFREIAIFVSIFLKISPILKMRNKIEILEK